MSNDPVIEEPVTDGAARAADPTNPHGSLNRRVVLAAGGVVGASAALLAVAGCGTATAPGGQATAGPGAGGNGGSQESAAQSALGPASAVPVGGGTIYNQQKVVVTQPTAGTYHAFSAICTHQGCTVSSVSNGTINCPCHGSKFRITDGSVAHGPATKPLPAKQVRVDNGEIMLS